MRQMILHRACPGSTPDSVAAALSKVGGYRQCPVADGDLQRETMESPVTLLRRRLAAWPALALVFLAIGCSRETAIDSRPALQGVYSNVPATPRRGDTNSVVNWFKISMIVAVVWTLLEFTRRLLGRPTIAQTRPGARPLPPRPMEAAFPRFPAIPDVAHYSPAVSNAPVSAVQSDAPSRLAAAISQQMDGLNQPFPFAFRRCESGDLWLYFRRDAVVIYDVCRLEDHLLSEADSARSYEMVTIRIQAGHVLRFVGFDRAIESAEQAANLVCRATEIAISPPDAATPVNLKLYHAALRAQIQCSEDDSAFRRAMGSDPDDELPRQIYADWLHERDHPLSQFMRHGAPFRVCESLAVGQGWQCLSCGPATWGQTIRAIQKYTSQSDATGASAYPGANELTRYVANPLHPEGHELHRLCVTLGSGIELPPFLDEMLCGIARMAVPQSADSPAV